MELTLSQYFDGNIDSFHHRIDVTAQFGLNIFHSSQDMIKDRAEQKAMFSPLHYSLYQGSEISS